MRLFHSCWKRVVLLLAFVIIAASGHAQTIEWIRQFGNVAPDSAKGVTALEDAVYIVGSTMANPPFPGINAYVRKYTSNGTLLWMREISSGDLVEATAVATDATGVYVVGVTRGALSGQTSFGNSDVFLQKYDFNGNLLWTSQFGTASYDVGEAVSAGAQGIYVSGYTDGTLPGQVSARGSDSFLRKFDANGNEHWTRQFGSASSEIASGVAIDGSGIYVTDNSSLRKFDPEGNELWTRQLGAIGLALDATGVYQAGFVFGALPGQPGVGSNDAYVRKFDFNGNELWTRQFGTSSNDQARAVAADGTGVYVGGDTSGIFAGQIVPVGNYLFVRKYDPSGKEEWTLQFGTGMFFNLGLGLAANAYQAYLVGEVLGSLPGQTSNGTRDAFVVKITSPLSLPAVSDGGVMNNASFVPNPAPLAPGSIAAVFGSNLNDGSSVQFSSYGPDGKLVTSLGGASATINNIAAPMFYSFPGQLGIQIPFEVAGQTTATIVVTVGGQSSFPRTINLGTTAPGIFTVNQQGTGIAAVLHEDGVSPITVQNPARRGEAMTLFATGLGALTPPLATGAPSVGNETVATPTITIDAVPAALDFSGAAPNYVGLNQVNLRIPASTCTASDIPVVLIIGGKQSNTVTIPVGP